MLREMGDQNFQQLSQTVQSTQAMWVILNRPTLDDYYTKYCDSFSDDYNANNKFQLVVVGWLVGTGVIWHIFVFFLFLISVYILLRSRNNILKVLKDIPKDVAGGVHQSLKRKYKNTESQNIANKNVLSIKIKLAVM
jgi:hypothetical protein